MDDYDGYLSDEAIDVVLDRIQADMASYADWRERRLWLGLAAVAVFAVLAVLTVGLFAFCAVVLVAYLVGEERGFCAGWNRACALPVETAIAFEEYREANRSWRDED